MSEYVLKVGDRVLVKKGGCPHFQEDAVGSIVILRPDSFGIRFDKYVEGLHTISHKTDLGHGWNVQMRYVLLLAPDVNTLKDTKKTTCIPASKYMDEMLGD